MTTGITDAQYREREERERQEDAMRCYGCGRPMTPVALVASYEREVTGSGHFCELCVETNMAACNLCGETRFVLPQDAPSGRGGACRDCLWREEWIPTRYAREAIDNQPA